MTYVIIDNTLVFFPPTQTCSCFGYTLGSLPFLKFSFCISCDLHTQPLLETPYYCYLKAWLWCSEYHWQHWKRNAKCFLVNHPNTVVWVTSWFPCPFNLKGYVLDVLSWISFFACPWENILLILVFKHIFLFIGLINPLISFSFPLVCLTFLVISMI